MKVIKEHNRPFFKELGELLSKYEATLDVFGHLFIQIGQEEYDLTDECLNEKLCTKLYEGQEFF